MPKKFYFKLYLFWARWVSMRSVSYALLLSLLSSLFAYISKGFGKETLWPSFAPLNTETLLALKEIVYISFPIAFSLSFIIMLLLVFKALFAQKIEGYRFVLYNCADEKIDKPLLSDVAGLWRKWLFVTLWAIVLFWILIIGASKLIFGFYPPLTWFNGLNLYLLVISLGGVVFVFGVKRCKKIGITDA